MTDPDFAERLRDEARRIYVVLTEARYLNPARVKQLAVIRRALSGAISLYESDEFPDEGTHQ